MSTDIKLSKTQISQIIQSGRSFGSWFSNLGGKALTNIAILIDRDSLPGFVSNLTSRATNKFERKNKWKRSCQSRKRIYIIYFE